MRDLNRIEKAEKLKQLEDKRLILNENIEAIESNYFNDGKIRITVSTEDFKHKGNDMEFSFTPLVLLDYLKEELKDLEKLTSELVKDLYGESL